MLIPAMLNDMNGRLVLVVDDNIDLAITTALVLRICGHSPVTAFSGRDAIEKARTLHPEIVLLDMGLPDENGHNVARVLRQEESLYGTRIIAISACEPSASVDATAESLFDDYLIKPVSMERLLAILSPSIC